MIDCPSPNHDVRALPVSIVVLHYTGMESATAALQRLTDAEAKVSSHYLIAEDGNVLRLVAEDRRAWHAGKSFWRGITDVNSASVGIEIVNPGHEFGYRAFPEAQMDALVPLLADIVKRHGVRPGNVIGHSDIAPARKADPGELFDWPRLAGLGLAAGAPAATDDPHWTDAGTFLALERYGYDVSNGRAAVVAFQRRFRPSNIDGVIDGETRAILLGLLLTTPQDELRLA
ncbi:N-acetylmuramoyl-L-alanine amidase [Sphingosinicella soli]|uniref:N-acetylmuramoyl-L-alanine amidase n=1 Tax=Sphingosinicella soli TaxID=333708 RepID=A0A7W7F6T4_9SPHN|nr:N-acetylmuramoyl-L-alanine amidase [Sphingosinicella soli]MBB4632900.1 N-acetylmuramoyl-L-alanine amidase [Sphingosinicella soli]